MYKLCLLGCIYIIILAMYNNSVEVITTSTIVYGLAEVISPLLVVVILPSRVFTTETG